MQKPVAIADNQSIFEKIITGFACCERKASNCRCPFELISDCNEFERNTVKVLVYTVILYIQRNFSIMFFKVFTF